MEKDEKDYDEKKDKDKGKDKGKGKEKERDKGKGKEKDSKRPSDFWFEDDPNNITALPPLVPAAAPSIDGRTKEPTSPLGLTGEEGSQVFQYDGNLYLVNKEKGEIKRRTLSSSTAHLFSQRFIV